MRQQRQEHAFTRRKALVGSAGLMALQACRALPTGEGREASAGPGPAPAGSRARIDLDQFVADCVAAGEESEPQAAVRVVVERAVNDPGAMLAAVGEPRRAGIEVFHRSPTLTVFSTTWTPQMTLMPHDHQMWALIGIYTGREDNIFWRRSNEGVTAYGANCLFEGDVAALPQDVIHSVTNPLERFTGGIHVYGGDFFATTRSQWDPETREEQPSDGATIRAMFERANERMRRMGGQPD